MLRGTVQITTILQGMMFILTFIITDCEILFVILVASNMYRFTIYYALPYFIFSAIFSFVEWILSLKRFTTDWFQVISIPEDSLVYHNNATTWILSNNQFSAILEEDEDPIVLSKSVKYNDTIV
ncbi:hypothetical protein I4U23_024702 [Adineta vaga]|nr:hypothetical protein I4U23_024702 [Adineta vaga]